VFNIDLSRYRVVDLSYLVEPNAGGDRPFVVRQGRLADNAFKYDVLDTHTHVGTHVESPAHFFENGKDIAGLPLDAFLAARCCWRSMTRRRSTRSPTLWPRPIWPNSSNQETSSSAATTTPQASRPATPKPCPTSRPQQPSG